MKFTAEQLTPEVVAFQDALVVYKKAKVADNGTYPWKLKLDGLAVLVAEAALKAELYD